MTYRIESPFWKKGKIKLTDNQIKKLLVVTQHFWPENFRINDICESFVNHNIQVDVLCGIPNYPKGNFYSNYNYLKPRYEEYKGIHVYRAGEIPQNKKGGKFLVSLNYIWFPIAALFNLPRLCFKNKYDLVFLFCTSPIFMGFPGIVYSRFKKIKSMIYVLDYWPDSLYSVIHVNSRLFRWVIKKISFWHYIKSDFILTPSKGILNKLRQDAGILSGKLHFLPQSCSDISENIIASPELHNRFDGKFNIVFTGNIGPAQSLETLVEAVGHLNITNKNAIDSLCLIIVGDGMSKNIIENMVRGKGLTKYFVFEGYVSYHDLMKYYELSDALFVSLSDDPLFSLMLPVKVQNYMAAGKIILASLSGEGDEIIKDANCGITCPCGSPYKLADAIIELINLPLESRIQSGKNGRQYYIENYRHEIFMDRLLEFFNNNI